MSERTREGGRRRTLDRAFTAVLRRSPAPGGWTCVVLGSAEFDGRSFQSSFMALGDGSHKLPVKADIRESISKDVGDPVCAHLDERLG